MLGNTITKKYAPIFNLGAKLFSTAGKYIVNNVSLIKKNELDTTAKTINAVIGVNIKGVLVSEQALHKLHEGIHALLIQIKNDFPRNEVTASVADPSFYIKYKVEESIVGDNSLYHIPDAMDLALR